MSTCVNSTEVCGNPYYCPFDGQCPAMSLLTLNSESKSVCLNVFHSQEHFVFSVVISVPFLILSVIACLYFIYFSARFDVHMRFCIAAYSIGNLYRGILHVTISVSGNCDWTDVVWTVSWVILMGSLTLMVMSMLDTLQLSAVQWDHDLSSQSAFIRNVLVTVSIVVIVATGLNAIKFGNADSHSDSRVIVRFLIMLILAAFVIYLVVVCRRFEVLVRMSRTSLTSRDMPSTDVQTQILRQFRKARTPFILVYFVTPFFLMAFIVVTTSLRLAGRGLASTIQSFIAYESTGEVLLLFGCFSFMAVVNAVVPHNTEHRRVLLMRQSIRSSMSKTVFTQPFISGDEQFR
jgi:hypothetical protein